MIVGEAIAKSSFFDTIEESSDANYKKCIKNLWLTQEQFQELYNETFEKYEKGNVLYSGIMCKQDNSEDVNEYFFQFYDKFLVQCSKNKCKPKIHQIMPLHFVRIEFQDENNSNDDDELPFFLLTKNKQYEILVPDNQKSFANWLKLFRPRCIMSFYGENYTNTKIIGKGSFAKVMMCVRHTDKKEFAVKIYDKKKIKNSKNSTLTQLGIQNEIKILQSLSHSNIIKLYEVYEGEYHVYLVLELLTGGELFNKLQTKESYSEKDAFYLMQNLLKALDHMHSKGIMHRDIKPENLILRKQESETEIVLADFGLSEKYTECEDNLIFKRCGTPGYVAPEILNNLPYDTQVDVFSIGIIFYIILTGYAPFFGDNYNEILEKNKKCKICFDFHKINIKLSNEATDLLKKMLIENPKERITVKQALNHPWMNLFKNNEENIIVEKLKFKIDQTVQNSTIKSTKPQNVFPSNNLIQISPVVNGNTQEIKNENNRKVLENTPAQKKGRSVVPCIKIQQK